MLKSSFMLRKILFIVVVVSLFSCSSNEQEEVDSSVVYSEAGGEVACNPQSNSNYIGEVKKGKVGIVDLGVVLPDFSKLSKYDIKTVSQIVPLEDGTESTKKVHHVYYNMTEVMFVESDIENPSVVNSITTFSPSYYLENCIHVGSTVESLQSKYQNFDVMLNFDDNMIYIISVENPSIVFMLTVDNLLDQSKVSQVDGQTSMSNINPKGTIISIRVNN